ncbi:MAG: DNA recombination/repair protein RecA, partial [Muribaculaceae bacterium]|nr:DNA recombination/repair protein RecA [Muribaculaceae bacterium]
MEKKPAAKKATIKKKDVPTDPKAARLQALTAALTNIEKNFGKGAIMKLGDEAIEKVEVIPSGSIGLHYA